MTILFPSPSPTSLQYWTLDHWNSGLSWWLMVDWSIWTWIPYSCYVLVMWMWLAKRKKKSCSRFGNSGPKPEFSAAFWDSEEMDWLRVWTQPSANQRATWRDNAPHWEIFLSSQWYQRWAHGLCGDNAGSAVASQGKKTKKTKEAGIKYPFCVCHCRRPLSLLSPMSENMQVKLWSCESQHLSAGDSL